MISPEDENNNEVRRVDQENINKFARLNARLHEVRREKAQLKVRCTAREAIVVVVVPGGGV